MSRFVMIVKGDNMVFKIFVMRLVLVCWWNMLNLVLGRWKYWLLLFGLWFVGEVVMFKLWERMVVEDFIFYGVLKFVFFL